MPTHSAPARADGLINKAHRKTVQIEAVTTTLGFNDHRRPTSAMEVSQTNGTVIGS
ncbi:hypothetical protein [Endozoicomonas sp. 8E]|uniref:hypothetical protein n=1 Tax=Endozoicomonas sp. 8E TaxID=3035692 RepID=UPI0029390D5D|nr:hypothetical protein [Endozoicomonas sp. 8E]WOG28599.1 hypothetical protein P6910_02780 [Endozoicomonas sp. 8E]